MQFVLFFISKIKSLYESILFSCASAKAERGLSSLSCVWMYVDQNKGTPPPPEKWHIHWKFLDFKSGFGFTTKIYHRLIFIFK